MRCMPRVRFGGGRFLAIFWSGGGLHDAGRHFACMRRLSRGERALVAEAGAQSVGASVGAVDARVQDVEGVGSTGESTLTDKEQWAEGKGEWLSLSEGAALEGTVRLAEDSGGEVHFVEHPGRGDRSVLVTPLAFVDGRTPLIVSLHGFGGSAAYQSAYVPLQARVNADGFALLLPNGALDGAGNRFWNPTDRCCEGGKSGEDDVAYLTELVAEARKVRDFGPVYFFGYSNGGFMAHHMACKGLPGLRAVASLAGTSYVEDSSCDGAPPVSVLHIHGTADGVIRFEGDESQPDSKGDGERAFYAGAQDMVTRWSRRAGCDWPERPSALCDPRPGPIRGGRRDAGIPPGIGVRRGVTIELWTGSGSSHAPGYGEAFVDALVGWLLSQG